jgi:hypothetical protein
LHELLCYEPQEGQQMPQVRIQQPQAESEREQEAVSRSCIRRGGAHASRGIVAPVIR